MATVREMVDAAVAMSAAALTIQRTLRGLTARQHVRAVLRLESQLSAIEKLQESPLSNDAIRANEALICLINSLESISGAGDCKTRVIRRAVTLRQSIETSMASSSAALRIQSAFRGSRERKNMGRLRLIESDLDTAVEMVREAENRDDIGAKERAMINERLMSLLFRLDSIRCLRNYRRHLVQRALAAQEALDAVPASEEANSSVVVELSGEIHSHESRAAEVPLAKRSSVCREMTGPERSIEEDDACAMENELGKRISGEKHRGGLRELVKELCDKNNLQLQLVIALWKKVETMEMAIKELAEQRCRI